MTIPNIAIVSPVASQFGGLQLPIYQTERYHPPQWPQFLTRWVLGPSPELEAAP
jgi:hypothetical protein